MHFQIWSLMTCWYLRDEQIEMAGQRFRESHWDKNFLLCFEVLNTHTHTHIFWCRKLYFFLCCLLRWFCLLTFFFNLFILILQHIEDLTQEKFSLQRALEASRTLAESLAAENSSLTDSYNQQVCFQIWYLRYH